MILDLPRFVTTERVYWNELQALLDRMRLEPGWRMSIPEIERLHYLYERCSAAVSYTHLAERAWRIR